MGSTRYQKLLITGGAGFIGSGFVRMALSRGHDVTVLDALTYSGHRENLDGAQPGDHLNLVEGNICDPSLVKALLRDKKPDAVINFAAESHVDRSITGPSEFIKTNVTGTFNLLENSLSYWTDVTNKNPYFRFVQISTDEVFGELGPKDPPFSETHPYRPNSPYSASKASSDHLVRAWFHTYGLPVLVTNCSNNYGPRQFPEKLIPFMIRCALENRPLGVYGDGSNIRDWIHVEDHCAGIALALLKGKPGESYCFGGGAERDNLTVVKRICASLDQLAPRSDGKPHESAITFIKDRPGHDWRYAINDSKAEKELGFKREYDFESGIHQTVKWYIENEAWRIAVTRKGET